MTAAVATILVTLGAAVLVLACALLLGLAVLYRLVRLALEDDDDEPPQRLQKIESDIGKRRESHRSH